MVVVIPVAVAVMVISGFVYVTNYEYKLPVKIAPLGWTLIHMCVVCAFAYLTYWTLH